MKTIDKLVVGFDGSTQALAALEWAAGLAAMTDAHVTVVHAVGLLEHAGLAGRRSPHEEVVWAAARKAGMDLRCLHWALVEGDPCSVLLRMANAQNSVDLLVVGTRGSGEHSGSLLGSTSLEVVEHATVPVVVVPSSVPESEQQT